MWCRPLHQHLPHASRVSVPCSLRSICPIFELIDPFTSYIPGHIHAFYLEYVYYDRQEQANRNQFATGRAPGIYSDRVQTGGRGYGTMVPPT